MDFRIAINEKLTVSVKDGKSLLATLAEKNIYLPTVCGGKGLCGKCRVKVLEGAGGFTAAEEKKLSQQEKQDGIRLACQIKVNNNFKIQIPEEILKIKEYLGKCVTITNLTADMKHYRVELIEPKEINFVPGQYMQLQVPKYERSSEPVYRAYSAASDPAQKNIVEFIIKRMINGIGTTYFLEYLKAGDEIRFSGPYGDFKISDKKLPMIFIAGGSGLSPFISMLHQMKNASNSRKVYFYYGVNRCREICLVDMMGQFEKELPNFNFIPVVMSPEPCDGWKGKTGLVTEAVKQDFSSLKDYEAYLCGPPGMIDASINVLKNLNVSEDKIFYDKFA